MTEKNYKPVADFLNLNDISEEEIISSTNLYKELLTLVNNDTDSIMFSNIESFSDTKYPNKIRLRNDNFLRASKEKKKIALISGVKLGDKNLYLIFISPYFYDYKASTNSNNSFIGFDFNELYHFVYNGEDTINIKNPKIKSSNKKYHRYMFYATYDVNFDKDKFAKFFGNVEEVIPSDDKPIKYTGNEYFVPQIPVETRKLVNENYAKKCALCSLEKDNPIYCPCGDQINIDYMEKNDLSYTHLHHLVPKKYFLNEPSITNVDWDIVHNLYNIVPLCPACHQSIHKGVKNKELVHNVFNAIMDLFKKTDKYDKFEKYIIDNTNFESVDNLLEFYKS